MADIDIDARGGTVRVEAVTPHGVYVVDKFIPSRTGAHYEVVDSGRIVLAGEDLDDFLVECKRLSATVEQEA